MSEPVRKRSGEHPAVRAFRANMESINQGTLPMARLLNERIRKASRCSEERVIRRRSSPTDEGATSSDPRREEEDQDARVEDEDTSIDVFSERKKP